MPTRVKCHVSRSNEQQRASGRVSSWREERRRDGDTYNIVGVLRILFSLVPSLGFPFLLYRS